MNVRNKIVYTFALLLSATALCGAAGDSKQSEPSQVCAECFAHVRTERADAEKSSVDITIIADGKKFTYKDAPIQPSDFTVIEEIERRRINAPLEKKIELIDEYVQNGADYKTALNVCFPLLQRTVDEIARQLYVEPINSRVEYKNKKFAATASRSGRALDENKLYGSLYYAVKYGAFDKIKASTVEVVPAVTQAELQSRLVYRGGYTTEYATSSDGRAHNVALAASKFDGLKIAAGETVSFNATVGERTEENGFKKAKIILNGEYADGVGGGACQASTAVYNAAIKAGLSVTANAHSICPSYCPPGLDAMISSASDMKITNGTGNDVYVSVTSAGKKTRVDVYGMPCEYDVEAESEIVETIEFEQKEIVDTEHKYFDEGAQSGDRLMVSPGKCGYISSTYLVYRKDGKVIKRVKVRSNVYKSVPQITVVAP